MSIVSHLARGLISAVLESNQQFLDLLADSFEACALQRDGAFNCMFVRVQPDEHGHMAQSAVKETGTERLQKRLGKMSGWEEVVRQAQDDAHCVVLLDQIKADIKRLQCCVIEG
jgi:hypothetical protein